MKKWGTLALTLLLLIAFCACSGSGSKEKIVEVFTTNPTYPEAVKILGEPDEEHLYTNTTDISYEKYSFYGLEGELSLGFVHSTDNNTRSNDPIDWLEWSYQGDMDQIMEVSNKVIADFDKMFGDHKMEDGDTLIWKNDQRIEILLFVEGEFLAIGYGNC